MSEFFLENIITTVLSMLSLSFHCEAHFSIVFRFTLIIYESSQVEVYLIGLTIDV